MRLEIVVFDKELETLVKREFREKATKEFVNLIRIFVAVHEHAFHEFITKERVIAWATVAWELGRGRMDMGRMAYGEVREELNKEAGTSEILNLIRIAASVHAHAFLQYGNSKEKLLEWVSLAWEGGKKQRRIGKCEEEGCINSHCGIVLNAGAYLYSHKELLQP